MIMVKIDSIDNHSYSCEYKGFEIWKPDNKKKYPYYAVRYTSFGRPQFMFNGQMVSIPRMPFLSLECKTIKEVKDFITNEVTGN